MSHDDMIWKKMQLTLLKQILLMEMDFYTHTNMQIFTDTHIYTCIYIWIFTNESNISERANKWKVVIY